MPAAVAHHPDLSDRAVHVFAALARFAGRTGRCWPSRETVAGAAGCSVRSVDRGLVELAAAGLIERASRGNGHGGRGSSVTTLTACGGGWAAVPEAALGCSSRAVRLVAVLDLMADRNGMVAASRGRLAELLACSTDSIDRALRELVAVGVVVRLPAAGKTGRLRLPHRPARPAAPVDSPAPATPAPSARVAAKVPQRWQGNENSLNENPDDTRRGDCNRGPTQPAAAPRSSGSASPSAARATAAWTRATCRTYAATVAAGRTDLLKPHAFVATVARQAAVERADRLAELHASGLDPAAAAAALASDGPATTPAPPLPRREPRPLGDPGCPVCEGDGWTPDLDGLMVRCACTAPDLDLEPAPPPVLEPGEVALDHAAALARIREIRHRRTIATPSA